MPDPLSGEPEVPVLYDHNWWSPDPDYIFGDDPEGTDEGAFDVEAG